MNATRLSKRVYAVDLGATLAGVLYLESGTYLVDSGLRESHAKKIEKAIDNILPSAITGVLHTHTHADHIGGSGYLYKKYGCINAVPLMEYSFAVAPMLTNSFIYGGNPPSSIKMMNAEAFGNITPAEELTKEDGMPHIINTPGHSPGHLCYLIDNILFAGDSLFSPEVIEKHKLLYLWNPEQTIKSLDLIEQTEFEKIVLAHKEVINKKTCIDYINNQKKHINDVAKIVERLAYGISEEQIASAFMEKTEAQNSPEQWVLLSATIRSYLSWLEKKGSICQKFQKKMIWSRK